MERFWAEGMLDPESNVQFGEGGAGTFSDGKLTTGIRDIRIRKVLDEFVGAGADEQHTIPTKTTYRYRQAEAGSKKRKKKNRITGR